jgi:hypothetical protein
MAIAHCDNCNNFRPGSSGEACGVEGFFCHICRGDELDPYGEIEEEIEAIEASLADAVRKAESGKDWAYIAWAEEEFLAPMLALRSEATLAFAMKAFDQFIANLKNWVEGPRP